MDLDWARDCTVILFGWIYIVAWFVVISVLCATSSGVQNHQKIVGGCIYSIFKFCNRFTLRHTLIASIPRSILRKRVCKCVMTTGYIKPLLFSFFFHSPFEPQEVQIFFSEPALPMPMLGLWVVSAVSSGCMPSGVGSGNEFYTPEWSDFSCFPGSRSP